VKHLPLAVAAVAVIATLIACTLAIERRLDALAPANYSIELAEIHNRLQAVVEYSCSIDRRLESIDSSLLPPAVRLHEGVHLPQPCPGDPGQPAQ
jgi:hypothetical protein